MYSIQSGLLLLQFLVKMFKPGGFAELSPVRPIFQDASLADADLELGRHAGKWSFKTQKKQH